MVNILRGVVILVLFIFLPQDRRQITSADLIEPAPETDLTQLPMPVDKDEDKGDDELRTGSSAKIDQLLHLLQLTPSDEKSLVFSQFTSFLDKVATPK